MSSPIRAARRVAWRIVAGLLAIAPAAAAEETHLVVPGHVELEPVPTALRLVLDWQDHGGEALDAFAARADLDAAGAAFAGLATALRAGDAEAAGRWLEPPEGATMADLVAFWGKAFGGFEDLSVLGRADLGQTALFLWSVPAERGAFVRAFVLEPAGDGFTAEIVGSNRPVLILIQHAAWHARSGAEGWQPGPLGGDPMRVALPVRGAGATVPLGFRGARPNTPVPGGAPEGEVLAFYERARALLAAGDVEAFQALHTPGSAEKLGEWLAGMSDEQRRLFVRAAADVPRRVVLLMDAAPLHLVFYTDEISGGASDGTLKYDTVYRDPATGDLRLTNFFYGSHLDTLFGLRGPFPPTAAALDEALGPAR